MQPFPSSFSLGRCGLPKAGLGALTLLCCPWVPLSPSCRAPRCHNWFLWDPKGIKLDQPCTSDGGVQHLCMVTAAVVLQLPNPCACSSAGGILGAEIHVLGQPLLCTTDGAAK